MSVEEIENFVDEEKMIEDLMMAEGFGDLIPHRWRRDVVVEEVITSNLHQWEHVNDIPEGIPFQPSIPAPPTSDFALWQCRMTKEGALSFAQEFSINPSIYLVFVTPSARKMSTKFISIPVIHFQIGLRYSLIQLC